MSNQIAIGEVRASVAAVKRWVRIIAGFVLIGLGIAGLFLPFLQGIAMIVAGLLLLAPEFRWARRLLEWAKRRWHQGRGTVRD